MATGVRVAITLACTECKRRNYQTQKSKRNTPDRVEFKKYCRWCGSHTPIARRGRRRRHPDGRRDETRSGGTHAARRDGRQPGARRRGRRPVPQAAAPAAPAVRAPRSARGGFVRESWAELKKVEWPNRAQVIQGTSS